MKTDEVKEVESNRIVPAATWIDRLPMVNETITGEKTNRTYLLTSVLGTGGYGIVFEATIDSSDETKFAIKTEKFSKSMLKVESEVLEIARQQDCKRIMGFIEYGCVRHTYCYLVMPLMGRNLSSLRNDQQNQYFSLQTSIRVGILTLQAIQELHEKCGYISRDIKPANFVIGTDSQNRKLFLIDFGLARKHSDQSETVDSSCKDDWRGTTRYESIQSHLNKKLSRKDDLESWFYMLIEFTNGALPWRTKTERNLVKVSKKAARSYRRSTFLNKCPKEYSEILNYIDALTFTDVPNYEKIISLLELVMTQYGYTWNRIYDWENDSTTRSAIVNDSSNSQDDKRSDRNGPSCNVF